MRRIPIMLLLLAATSVPAADEYLVDWDEVADESIRFMVDLIKIDSSNPPGNETIVANYLHDALATEGIRSDMYALDPDRANLVAKHRGNGSKRPILIMGHTDVVGVQRDQWSVDPFAAVQKDGYIYGRGSLDDKDNVTAGLMVMLLLKRFEVPLDRDIIFLAEAGEEGTPQVGVTFMVENHWDVIAAEFCLAEGGYVREHDDEVEVVGIQTTEKMPRRANLVARGTAGHGSRPRVDNAVTILASAVARVGVWQTPLRLNGTTSAYFERMATLAEGEAAFRYGNIADPAHQDSIQDYFRNNDPYHYSVLRTSVVPTIMKAGFRKNVIPSEALATLDIRMLPDEDVEGFYGELAKVIGDPRVEIVPEEIYRPGAPPSEIDNEMFQTLEKVSKQMYPESTTLPVMSTGATDMAQIRAKGTQAYGLGPMRTLEEMNSRFGAHSDDERISEESLLKMVQFLWYTILEIAATS